MANSKSLITLEEYLNKKKMFLIPSYQRGYIWGKSHGEKKDSVTFLLESIKSCIENDSELFLQGVTVSENDDVIEIIDGQQRTTAFYLLLVYLGYQGPFTLKYQIRQESQVFLDGLKSLDHDALLSSCKEKSDEEFQDVYFFKNTVRLIDNSLKSFKKSDILMILLKNVKFLYIDIPSEKATTVFSMMNGNKAQMKYEEIIKAEILRLVSEEQNIEDNQSDNESLKWEQNLLRSKYAREWDKWLYWWNREDIKKYYHTENIMGLLIETYYYSQVNSQNKFSFENFRDFLLRNRENCDNCQQAKKVFYELRKLQKKFEDVFYSFDEEDIEKRIHNSVQEILILLGKDDRKSFIREFFLNRNKELNIEQYKKLVYLGITHTQIMKYISGSDSDDSISIDIEDKKNGLLKILNSDDLYNENLYGNNRKQADKQLLRLNVIEDTKLRRKFDFNIWNNISLEHIYPKSKVYHTENSKYKDGANNDIKKITSDMINRESFNSNGSEHCIGNLVLLYKNENSSFGAKSFEDKKALYFDLSNQRVLLSRHLLHSISVFANKQWGVEEIQKNKKAIIDEIRWYYEI